MRRLTEWQLYFKYHSNYVQKKAIWLVNAMRHNMYEKHKFTPLQREISKYNMSEARFPYKWHFVILGIFSGLTANIVYNKVFYEDYQIRDPGSAMPSEIPFVWCLYRYIWYLIFSVFQGHPVSPTHGSEFIRAKLRLEQYFYYMKRKNKTFDFMNLGELEQIPFD